MSTFQIVLSAWLAAAVLSFLFIRGATHSPTEQQPIGEEVEA